VSAYKEGGRQWERAEKAVAVMRAAAVQPDVISYEVLVSAHEKGGGQWERGE
jgi:hypothetical protein